jgi:shikimate kinase
MGIDGKIIYLLIGPKGSGKSFIGTLMECQFNIKFVRVEDWMKDIKKDRQINDESYISDAFQAIEAGVRNVLKQHSKIVFESTGLSSYFDRMLNNLSANFKVITIKVNADDALCIERVKNRDTAIHINVSDNEVQSLNGQVKAKNIITDYSLDNNNKNINELSVELGKIIKQQAKSI